MSEITYGSLRLGDAIITEDGKVGTVVLIGQSMPEDEIGPDMVFLKTEHGHERHPSPELVTLA